MQLTINQYQDYTSKGVYYPLTIMSEDEALRHEQRLCEIEALHGPMHYRVKPYLILRSAYEIATNPLLLDAVESVLGPDILLWDSSYVIKEPASEGFISWHQDLTYWGLQMDSDDDLVTAWVALTPATVENGCMQFVIDSHRQGQFKHHDTYDEKNILHRGQSIQDDFDQSQVEQIELRAGQASLHHGWAVHSSNQNLSSQRRVGLTFNYVRTSVRQTVGQEESATLVRGRDDYGHFLPEPVCESDFAAINVDFQLAAERKKREVYDTA